MATQPVERPGNGSRLKAWISEVGRSFFPSMGWNEWRSVLRGDPAPRPNPRMRVHNNSFWYHIRPRALPEEATAWYYTMGLGWLSFFFFVIESITGLVLMVFYVPSAREAYDSMQQIITDVPLGNLMRELHRLGAHFMVALVFAHMMRTYFTASYKAPRQFAWVTGVILLLVTLVLSFSGYLLPWDQLAYWAVTIGTSMAETAPLFGNAVNLLLRGAPDIGQGTLLRFYLLHIFLLPMAAIILISVHYYAVRKQEISPIHELFEKMPASKRKIPFLPDQVYFEVAVVAVLTFAFIVINQYFWAAHLESHANPLVTPQHTKAPWYFLWLQGLLKMGDPFFFGVLIPTLLFGGLFAIPYIDRNPSRRFKDRKIAIIGAIVALIMLGFLTYAGLPTYGIQQTGSSELVFHWVPGEGRGRADHVPFDHLPNSRVTYDSATRSFVEGDPNSLTPEARALFDEFQHDVEFWQREDPGFADGSARLTIEPWQIDGPQIVLKKVTLVVTVNQTEQLPSVKFLHRNKDLE
ncbi:MAG: cytochrome bc complex cytochrome b subunit [Chloroflexales bacterium]|nr:cytochrome bc complex cytochrome b subunit [Chloroflexales bacterium]